MHGSYCHYIEPHEVTNLSLLSENGNFAPLPLRTIKKRAPEEHRRRSSTSSRRLCGGFISLRVAVQSASGAQRVFSKVLLVSDLHPGKLIRLNMAAPAPQVEIDVDPETGDTPPVESKSPNVSPIRIG